MSRMPVSLLHVNVDVKCNCTGSAEEINNLKSGYVDCKGDLHQIMESVLCATMEDEPRFRSILEQAIRDKEIPSFKNFMEEKAGKKTERQNRVSILVNLCH